MSLDQSAQRLRIDSSLRVYCLKEPVSELGIHAAYQRPGKTR
jgi:hypothetical protein